MNGKSKVWALALLAIVLLLGAVSGAAVDRALVGDSRYDRSSGRRGGDRDRHESHLDWLSQELNLTVEQRAQVEAKVEQHREAVSVLWSEMRPRFEEAKTQLNDEIREILDEEQRAAYEALLEEASERRRHRREGR
jgi:Spy/CpxP family protein refolding chaperone